VGSGVAIGQMAREGATIAAAVTLPDRYRVVRHLARGGMATVWEAEDKLLGRRVAVKVLAEHLAEDSAARDRFQREARAAAKVSNHPNVVTIYDVGESDGRPFIVMELLTGGTVAQRLRAGRPSHRQALEWLAQAAEAIDDTHARGLVHRDIKPGNLLLDERGRLAVADFGIARLARDQTVTTTGQLLGTAAYLSPEQARGDPASAASDRYSLAVVAYELLTGRRPFTAEHFAAQARQHLEAAPPPASSIRPELPPAVDAVLGKGLAKEPARRWPTACAMVNALEDALDGIPQPAPTSATQVLAPRKDGPQTEAGVPPPAAFPRVRRRKRGARVGMVLALLAVVALVGAIVSVAFGGGDRITARTDHATNKRALAAADDAKSKKKTSSKPKTTSSKPNTTSSTPNTTSSTPTRSGPPAPATSSGDPAALNEQGFRLLNAGHPNQAIPVLQKAVDTCHGDPSNLSCAYAMYNLGKALRLAGRPDEAVTWLERRLQNPDQRATVERELAAARAAANGTGGASAPSSGSTGKAKGNDKAGKGKDKGD
jgi:eukaryotic-like serine/threonine-protein kinase